MAAGSPPASVVRAQLARILASEVFARSDRLTAFLTYIVEQTLDGRGAALKEQVLAMEVYGKDADFSAAADPIVRVDARRLRDKLREYYASAPHDPVVISVPKGSYAPVFDIRPLTDPAPTGGDTVRVETRARSLHRSWVAAAVVVLIGVMAWLVIGQRTRSAPPVRLLTVTSFPGLEGNPSLSPDGNFLAFTWTGPDFTADGDVWVKAVDGDALRRLTDTPHVNEISLAWSPDGRQIAFVRLEDGENRGIYLVSALGGSERKVSDSGWKPTWLPDSQSLVFEDVVGGSDGPVHYDLATGARRQLTTPPPGFVDITPRVSRDGKTLAFVRSTTRVSRVGNTIRAGLFVVPMAGGDAVQLDDRASGSGGPEWTPDNRELLYPRWDPGGVRVFRVAATGGTPVPAEGLPISEISVSTSGVRPGGTFRVAVIDAQSNVGLRMIDVQAPLVSGRTSAWTDFCDSTRIDWPGRFSRDGAQVSFTSDRNGLPQILTASRDGTQMRTLTSFDGSAVGLAAWSPDGRSLVFDAIDRQNRTDLYVVGSSGGPLRRLTNDDQRESPDGRSVYFLEPPSGNPFWVATTLKRVGVEGGIVDTVLPGARQGRWDVADTGIVFLTGPPGLAPDPATPDALEFHSFADGRSRRVGELPFPVTSRGYSPPRVLIVSPDGRWVVVSHMDHWARDIVVADNFR